MKFLINNKEYSGFLAHRLIMKKARGRALNDPSWKKIEKYRKELQGYFHPADIPGLALIPRTANDHRLIKKRLIDMASGDLERWIKQSVLTEGYDLKLLQRYINRQFDQFTDREKIEIHRKFVSSQYTSLTKALCQGFRDIGVFQPRDQFVENSIGDVFIRNTVNNESLLKTRMANHLPFLFMDSGYTNFLENNKKWHRLCRDNIHHSNILGKCNHKRLNIFPCLPRPWRTDGSEVLIIEPSEIQCRLFDIDIVRWRAEIRKEVNSRTSRSVVFREKADKKIRTSLYQYLLDSDVYCVINYNSNAAVEAVWAGVPVITLGRHITNPIAASSLDQINDLLRPDLERWLKFLSHCQYTVEEIQNGTARRIMEEVLRV